MSTCHPLQSLPTQPQPQPLFFWPLLYCSIWDTIPTRNALHLDYAHNSQTTLQTLTHAFHTVPFRSLPACLLCLPSLPAVRGQLTSNRPRQPGLDLTATRWIPKIRRPHEFSLLDKPILWHPNRFPPPLRRRTPSRVCPASKPREKSATSSPRTPRKQFTDFAVHGTTTSMFRLPKHRYRMRLRSQPRPAPERRA